MIRADVARGDIQTSADPKQTSAHPRQLLRSLVANRALIAQLARREILGRYRGSALGIFWSLIHPILMLVVYTFVFSVVFQTRWPGAASDSKLQFAIVLFAGMIVFGIFAECAQRAPNLVVSQPNFVKKVVFPLEIMAWSTVCTALFHAAVSFAVLTVLLVTVTHTIPWTAIYLPLTLLPLIAFTLGLTWFLSALGVYVRDIHQIVGIVVTALLFLSPLFYPSSALPEGIRWISTVNPIAFGIESTRDVIVFGRSPSWILLSVYFGVGLVVMWLGFAWFQKTRRGFADVL